MWNDFLKVSVLKRGIAREMISHLTGLFVTLAIKKVAIYGGTPVVRILLTKQAAKY